jgi:O-antigen/teichoic acid export membrane protein
MIAAPWLAELLLNSPSFSGSVRLAALVVLLLNLTVPGFSWLRAEKRAIFSSILTITNLIVTLGATIVLVGVFHMGINGSLIAMGGGYAAVVVCTLPVILLRAGLRLRFDIVRNLVFFGGPIIFTFISAWVLQLSDRYLLSYFGSLVQTANYTVAYSLGGVLAPVILGPFSLAWPPIMYAIAKRDDAVQVFRLVFRWFGLVLFFAAFALSLAAKFVLYMLFPSTYHSVAPLIPIITLGIMFYGVYNFITIGIYIQRKTSLTAILTALAALVNLGLNIILIPRYESMGAAISTLLAYALLALIAYIVNQRIYPIPFEMGIFIVGLIVGIVLYVGSSYLAHTQKTYIDWGISMVTLTLYAGCLTLLGRLPAGSRKKTYSQEE